ncbi:zinc carboxypeptidase (plasmid) [Alcanivorax sp. N3-2A]|nr:zinc carboxypeptidase [Alcanivorax sp. N3-2A]ASK36952.1 zinc carboxypeptidase [Alcanivorax sp. N3-2A]|tara:strand:+ start:3069 stop:4127 length:1059 start_codon:yes stop_codon:yes gene_type:complete
MQDTDTALRRHLPEQIQLDTLLHQGARHLRVSQVLHVAQGALSLPVTVIEMGSRSPGAPVIGFFAGVHGVERIGTQVILSWLHSLIHRLQWDDQLVRRLERVRLVFMPMVNPAGLWRRTRANPNGVDLMRNAPVQADGKVSFLVGGHRISRHLPWYRGRAGEPMQAEAQALVEVVRDKLLSAPVALSVDCHSGFGRRDRLWCCYARSHQPIDHLAEVFRLKQVFEQTYPHHHPYLIEPQSVNYTTHGDLWDYLYDEARARHPRRLFLPFTLEMGSWLWVRKNPRQMFDFFGYFNPIIDHRQQRVLRQHLPLFEFLLALTANAGNWLPTGERRQALQRDAVRHWFKGTGPAVP